jgi:carnitine-CoA ligase
LASQQGGDLTSEVVPLTSVSSFNPMARTGVWAQSIVLRARSTWSRSNLSGVIAADTSPKAGRLGRSLSFRDRTLPRIVQIQASLGDKVMIQTAGHRITYGEAPALAACLAGVLASAGIEPGDRVVTFLSTRREVLELWLGATWAGAILTPVNSAFRGAQLERVIRTAAPAVVITEPVLLPHIRAVPYAVAGAHTVFVIDPNGKADTKPINGATVKPFFKDAEPLPLHPARPADPAAILYTSGTTGPSKGVICPHAQFFWWGVLTGESLGINPNDVLFTVLPFFHTNALNTLWQSLLVGATYAFSPRFSASRFWSEAAQSKATITYLLGAMAHMLLKQPPSELDAAHRIHAALSPATPPEVVTQFHDRFGVKLIEGYGSTETNLVFSNVIGGHEPGTMGRVVDGFDVRIVDEEDCDVAEGQAGELLIRHREPFSMASGYFGDAEATVKAWRNLWFHTGDRVTRDANGVHRFLDRAVDAIRRRGENISSWEVEHALMSHPDVENAAVIGVPSEMGEEEVMAFVATRQRRAVDPITLIRFLESRLAYFAIPRYWEFLSELPQTENGKVKKHLLRAKAPTSTTWDREKAGVQIDRGSTPT